MKIKLTQDHPILGTIVASDTIVDIREGVAIDLINRKIAIEVAKPKPKKKEEDPK